MRFVALDEAHDDASKIYKDLKTTVCPSKEYLDRMLYYYPVRSVVLNAVKNAVMLDLDNTKTGKVCVFDPSQIP